MSEPSMSAKRMSNAIVRAYQEGSSEPNYQQIGQNWLDVLLKAAVEKEVAGLRAELAAAQSELDDLKDQPYPWEGMNR